MYRRLRETDELFRLCDERREGGSRMDWEALGDAARRKAVEVMVEYGLKHLEKDGTDFALKILELAKVFYGKTIKQEDYERVKKTLQDPDNKWVSFILRTMRELDPNVAKMTLLNMGYEAFLRGTRTIRAKREVYHCNIPWLILFDPTSACNMHCTGCWAGTYGNRYNLSYEDMDRIVSESKQLGTHLFMLTGGEPLIRKKDILKLAEEHHDVQFAIFTNSTLIDDDFCKEVVRLGNIIFLLSIEGTPETNDGRRGDGHYEAVMHAMDLLRQYGILFGTSICYTRDNVEAVTSDAFFHLLMEKGARFGFYFHYMPTGNAAAPQLLPTTEQRRYMIDRIRSIRTDESPIEFFPMDFQNDGEYVGGCIAGGRNYFHINSAGDAEPCVFIHYSNANIHDASILEILQSPLFQAYHREQPFNRNHLRPCPMLENPEILQRLVNETGAHSTDMESEESVEHLCAKCEDYAAAWQPNAEEIWASQTHKKPTYENYIPEKRQA